MRHLTFITYTLIFTLISTLTFAENYKDQKKVEALYGQIYYLYINDMANHVICKNELNRYSLGDIHNYLGRKSPEWMRENIWPLRKKAWTQNNEISGEHYVPKNDTLIYLNILAEAEGIDFLGTNNDLINENIKFYPESKKMEDK